MSTPARIEARCNFIAFTGLALLAFAAFRPVATANYAFGLLLLWLTINWQTAWPRLKKDPLFWVSIAFLVYLLLISLSKQNPASDFRNWRHALENTMKAGFAGALLVAIAYHAKPVNIRLLASLMLLGLLLEIGTDPRFWQTESWLGAWQGLRQWRFKLGYSANSLGLWCDIMLLALLTVLRPRKQFFQNRLWLPGLYAGTGLLLLFVLLLSHSRVAWATLPLGLLPAGLSVGRKLFSQQQLTLGIILSLGLAATVSNLPVVKQQYALEKTGFRQLFSGERQKINSESLGDRLAMLAFFTRKWPEHPLTGHGPGSTPGLLKKSTKPPTAARISQYRHIHNSYLQILLETGLIGVLFYLFFWVRVLIGLHRQRGAVADWLKGALLMLAFFALFNHPVDGHQGPTVIALLSGLALANRELH